MAPSSPRSRARRKAAAPFRTRSAAPCRSRSTRRSRDRPLLHLGHSTPHTAAVPAIDLHRSPQRLSRRGLHMADTITRDQLIQNLNEDLSREYQASIAYVVHSQVLKGAEYMTIAKELEKHASEELSHALKISKHIDYLGGMPNATPCPVTLTDDAREMLRADLDNENATVRAYRDRVRQCEALGEFGIAEDIREIIRQEQEHQIDLATALGEEVPDVSRLAP